MSDAAFRLYVDDEPAKAELLSHILQIQVEQRMNVTWEGRLSMAVCTDESGNWTGQGDDDLAKLKRARVEVSVSANEFVPLIDGPIVGYDLALDSEPGTSVLTLVIHDDGVLLDLDETPERYDAGSDSDIAESIFKECRRIKETLVTSVDASSDDPDSEPTRRGTRLRFLRMLARRNGMYAYVLPGSDAGKSTGVFGAISDASISLPALQLLGADRNIESFRVRFNELQGDKVQASTLRLADRAVIEAASGVLDSRIFSRRDALDDAVGTNVRMLAAGQHAGQNLERAVGARLTELAAAYNADGVVRHACYHGVMSPYQYVTVKAVGSDAAGVYLIYSVLHTITPSMYTQKFGLKRDIRQDQAPTTSSSTAGAIP